MLSMRPAIGAATQPQGPTRLSLPTKISKTTPCKVAGGRRHRCLELSLQKHFDTSGKSAAQLYRPAIAKRPWPCSAAGSSARLHAKTLTHNRNSTGSPTRRVASRVAEPRASRHARTRGDIDVNTVPDLNKPTALAATGQTKAAAAPRIKLLSHGYAIDHPDPELGEQLVAQMVSVHVMAMRCAYHLANAQDVAQQDSAGRAFGRLARTFPAQIEALNRYRSHGEPAITVQNVSVGDGGKAIVGNVTQHASVIVSDKNRATAVTAARRVPMPDRSEREHEPVDARREAWA